MPIEGLWVRFRFCSGISLPYLSDSYFHKSKRNPKKPNIPFFFFFPQREKQNQSKKQKSKKPNPKSILPRKKKEKKKEIHNLHSLGPFQTQKNQQQHPQPFTHENPRPQPFTITIHSPQHTTSPNDSQKRKQATAKPSNTMRAAVVVCGDEGK